MTDSELAWVVVEANCGWPVPPDDDQALAAAIEHAYHNPAELQQKGANGRDYVVAHYSRQAIACQYDVLIRQVVEGKPGWT